MCGKESFNIDTDPAVLNMSSIIRWRQKEEIFFKSSSELKKDCVEQDLGEISEHTPVINKNSQISQDREL